MIGITTPKKNGAKMGRFCAFYGVSIYYGIYTATYLCFSALYIIRYSQNFSIKERYAQGLPDSGRGCSVAPVDIRFFSKFG